MPSNPSNLHHPRHKFRDLKYYVVKPKSWNEAKAFAQYLPHFAFRGHASSKWVLTTTLERAAERHNIPLDEIYNREKFILREFKARAHHFINSPPSADEIVEWLSIIQDFGGPTRLLDFTTSFYVASFFAIEAADDDACVWAINSIPLFIAPYSLDAMGNERIFADDQYESLDFTSEEVVRYAETFVRDPSKAFDLVLRVKPTRINERIAIQKGLFLCPCDLSRSFESNLCATFGLPFETLDSANASDPQGLLDRLKEHDTNRTLNLDTAIIKIVLPKKLHLSAIEDLHNMNIDAASLFPGLEGFARSLNYLIGLGPLNIRLAIDRKKSPDSETLTPSTDSPSTPE